MSDCGDGICGGTPPGIARHPETDRPWVVGTGVYVDDVLAALEDDGSYARVARALGLTVHQVRVAEAWADAPAR